MATVLLFHHLHGLTPGVVAFADTLRDAGHTVHTPDLFGGRTFASIEEGSAFTRADDAPDVDALADAAAAPPCRRTWSTSGFSFGVMPAQRLAQTRPGAAGARAVRVLRTRDGRVGVRPVARRRPGPGPRDGCRPVLRRRR